MLAKEIERVGIPVVQVANMVPIAQMVGSNRIKRGNSIVCPLGDPELPPEREKLVRKKMVQEALEMLTKDPTTDQVAG